MNKVVHFLKSEFEEKQKRNASFSLRSFAKWLDISPAQTSQILSGKRPITNKMAKKIFAKMNLSQVEQLNYINSLNDFDNKTTITPHDLLDEQVFEIISAWQSLAILSLAKMKNCKKDVRWIAQQLNSDVSLIHALYQKLLRLNIIEETPTAYIQKTNPFTVTSQRPSRAIRNYHKQILSLAAEKIDTVPNEFRNFQSMTICLDPKKLDILNDLTQKYLDQIELVASSSDPKQVYKIAIQLFPVTVIKQEN